VGNQPPNPPTTGFDPPDGEPVFSLQPTLNWDDGTDDLPDPASTLHYQVQVDDNDDWTDANVVDTTTADGITEVTLGTALTENAQYWYRVRTIDDEGAESDWSTSQLFWVNSVNDDPLPPSSGFSPNNGAETELQRPPLNWNAATDPDDPSSAARQTDTAGTFTYTVQLAAQSDIATNGFDYQYSTSAPGETQLIPGDSLADETTWYWRVRTVDDEGATSDWSLEQHFNVNTNNQPPVLSDGAVTPVMGDLDTTFEFSVVYTDAENDAPIDDIMVHVGANSLDLAMVRDPNDNDDFSEGVTYLASVRGDNAELGLGGFEHHYYIAGTEIRYPDAPETVFGPVVAAAGTIRLTDSAWADTDTYEEGDTVYIEVADADENQDPAAPDTVEVTVTGDGDSETVTLTETGNDTGVYQGQLAMLGAAGSADDGQLNVVSGPSGSQITAIWADPDETPLGVTPATDEATVSDTIAPNSIAAGELALSSINEGRAALIDWQAYDETAQPNNQPDVAAYHIWQSDTDFTDTADATRIATVPAGTQTHEVTGLNLGEEYFFAVSVADEVPNEDTSVVAKSVLTNDTDAPVVENWQYDAEAGTLSFDLTDASGVDMSMFALRVDGTDVTGDATWDDSDIVQVSVDYAAPNGWGYNRQVDFAVDIADIHGNAATYDFQEDAPIDDTLPTADQFTPADGDDNASAGTEISARLRDTESGVDSDTVIMTVNGDDVSDELTFPETAAAEGEAELRVSYQPAEPLTYATEYTVHLEFADAVGNVATADWTFTVEDEPMFEIRGTVTDENGDPMAGVEVTVDGRTVGTDGNGAYTVSDLSAGDYTVTPSLADYTFDPASREVTVGPDANDIDFIGRLQTYAISGQITRGGTGVEGVTVSDGTRTATTDADGHYTINDVPSGSYAVTPSRDADDDGMEDFNYTPSSRTVTVQGAPETDVDFTATLVTYSISGLITDTSGNRVAGVSVTDGTRTAITNESGQYTISDVPPSTVTVTATKTGLAFDPESTEVTVPPDGTGVNFTAYTEFRQRFQAGVHMVGVPATPPSGRDRAVDIFGTDNVARWDAEGSPAGYVFGTENPDASQLQIRPGVGLFVNFAGVTDVTVPGDPVPDTAASSVGVATGWNQVGNMYQTALPMANISGAGSTQLRPFAFVWDNSVGSYRMISREPAFNSARTYIEAWEAAWFKTTGAAGSLNIEGPANVAAASLLEGAAARSEAPDNGWLVEVVARVADRADVTSVAGVGSGDASRGYRIENPPMMPGSVDVYFTDESGARLAHDIRPQSSGAMVWPFCVETDIADAEVEMTLPDLSGVPNDMAVYLTDVDSGKRMYARTLPAYTFNTGADGALRHFELEVAPRGADNLAIRTASVQAGSGGLMVTYDLSSAANVSIEVMNIAGRSVRTLIESRAVSAGSNEQMWDMRSADGTVVPNGSYLIKIEAVADNGQRVQALRPAQIAR
ncbi:MAG: carboxypeptidase regulatory-like domain-containing protein, partial [Armatimonadota bacterium]